MALPKFEKSDGTGAYVLEEFSSLPGDRADLASSDSIEIFVVQHKRNNVTIGREVIATKNFWDLFFKNVSATMKDNLRTFALESQVRYYPNSDSPTYFRVYWISKWRPKLQRGGTYNIPAQLLEV